MQLAALMARASMAGKQAERDGVVYFMSLVHCAAPEASRSWAARQSCGEKRWKQGETSVTAHHRRVNQTPPP